MPVSPIPSDYRPYPWPWVSGALSIPAGAPKPPPGWTIHSVSPGGVVEYWLGETDIYIYDPSDPMPPPWEEPEKIPELAIGPKTFVGVNPWISMSLLAGIGFLMYQAR